MLQPSSLRDPDVVEQLTDLAPDCCPVVAYGGLVPPAALAVPAHGWLNLHFSLLPAWRGAAPVQHAIMHGDRVTGASVFLLEEGLDTGPVLATQTEPIAEQDTAGSVLDRLSHSGSQLLVRTLDAVAAGTATPVPQPTDGVSLAPKLTTDDARIVFSHVANEVDQRVRGCTPHPGAWTLWRGERVKLGPVQVSDHSDVAAHAPLLPGNIRVQGSAVFVGTGSVPVVLGTVQPPGKRPMPAADWARGARPAPGETFQDSEPALKTVVGQADRRG